MITDHTNKSEVNDSAVKRVRTLEKYLNLPWHFMILRPAAAY